MRDYKGPEVIFGGDPACEHDWHEQIQPAANGIIHDGGMSGETLSGTSATRKPKRSNTCTRCGAWRGSYGLEPTLAAYIAHTVEIFEEVRRVLRKDGTLWLNIGDAYASSGGSDPTGSSDGAVGRGERGQRYKGNLKPKDLIGLPWRIAFALQEAGWWLRSDIIWAKPNPMPESVTDRPTRAHEYVFLLTKSARYAYDADAIRQPGDPLASGGPIPAAHRLTSGGEFKRAKSYKTPDGWDTGDGAHGTVHRNGREKGKPATPAAYKGSVPGRDGGPGQDRRSTKDRVGGAVHVERGQHSPGGEPGRARDGTSPGANARTVWTIATQAYPKAHFATYPEELPRRCIRAGCPLGGTVLDPFAGSGTTGAVALTEGRRYILIENNPDYLPLIEERIAAVTPSMFMEVTR